MSSIITKHIQTDSSFLDVHVININNFSALISDCVSDISDKLYHYPPITVYGKAATQHRDVGFFSDKSIGYHYSNQLSKSIPLTPNLTTLLNIINDYFRSNFNGILINRYANGDDYISAHSDSDVYLGNEGVVAISFGAIRKFRIRDKKTKKIIVDVPTVPCEIIRMGGDFQKEFTHEIPIEKKIKTERYSFTFRNHDK